MNVNPGLVYLILGVAVLLAVLVPKLLERANVSAPMVLLASGMGLGLLPPLRDGLPDVVDEAPTLLHVTELTVLVALMGVGLAIDRPFDPRSARSWRAWSPTWRLIFVAMPLTIAGVALLAGPVLGCSLAAAILLGGTLAPTDPVLASDVQVGGPSDADEPEEIDEKDEVRFALTSEAGLNDGFAFPFVHAALLAGTAGAVGDWAWQWFARDVLWRSFVGVVVGVAVGWALARMAFRSPYRTLRLAEVGEPLLALAILLTAYGLAEVSGGYGFLAVFCAAMTVRGFERAHDYHAHMHEAMEWLERLLTLVVLLFLGAIATASLLPHLDWKGALIGLTLVFVIRPLAGLVAFLGHRTAVGERGLDARERLVAGFFGVRGVGSLFYLSYAAAHGTVGDSRWAWATVAFTVVVSVFVHGLLAQPAMAWQERADRRGRRG